MADFESTSVEMSEVAEPTEETGVEEPEVAAPESEPEPEEVPEEHQRTDADASFAAMRREMEEARRQADDARAELERVRAESEARDGAISRLTGTEDGTIAALAEVTGMSEDEIRAEMEAAQESAQKDLRIQQLEEQINSVEAERLMQADLAELRKIDPSLNSLDDLGESYAEYIAAGLNPTDAYWAIKGKEYATRATAPKEVGKVATGTAEKDYYTDAEIEAMSSEQLTKNWKKVMASWERNSQR